MAKETKTWQNEFLEAGTLNGCGDLSIMIPTVSSIIQDNNYYLAAKLRHIVSKGAPSQQESPIKYGAEIWNSIHNLIDELENN